ncbi:MAG: efflux RND transporter periplasmic adaptor subunit [Candidatus Obscuribacterales bacterium]|nr:efflux RND transporter periplasmic adaptor subunit [Candidatus Obscuribacterales bacterium]
MSRLYAKSDNRRFALSQCLILSLTTLFLSSCNQLFEFNSPATNTEPVAEKPPVSSDEPITLDPSEIQKIQLSTETVASHTLPIEIDVTGIIRKNPNLSTNVISLLPGRIEDVWVQHGDSVKKGKALAKIRSDEVGQIQTDLLASLLDLEAERKQAELKETFAQKQFDRKKVLFESKIAARVEVEEAENALEQAKAEVHATEDKRSAFIASSKERLKLYGIPEDVIDKVEKTRKIQYIFDLTAPRDGIVTERDADPGELVTSGKSLFTISDLSSVWLVANVLEDQVRFVKVGLPVRVAVESLPGEKFSGTLDFVDSHVDGHTRTLAVRATIQNAGVRLKPEMFTRLHIQTGTAHALTVPHGAVQKIGDSTVVYIAQSDGRFRERKITTGRHLGDAVEVLAGLHPGDKVVVRGSLQLLGQALQRMNQ